jgi:hypothetical protein
MLLVEQNVRTAVEIADRAGVLDDGRSAYPSAAEFAKDEEASARLPESAPRSGAARLGRLNFFLQNKYCGAQLTQIQAAVDRFASVFNVFTCPARKIVTD